MSDFSNAQANFPARITSRSMGMKLMLVGMLALFMTVPSLFVGGLVDERARRAEDATKQMSSNAGGQQTFFGSSIREADTYQSVTRSLKYVLLFLGLVFLTYLSERVTD